MPEVQTPRSEVGIQPRVIPVGHLYEHQRNSLQTAGFGFACPRDPFLGRETTHTTITSEQCLNTRLSIGVRVSKKRDCCIGGAFAMSERALQKLGDHETYRNAGEAERGSESF